MPSVIRVNAVKISYCIFNKCLYSSGYRRKEKDKPNLQHSNKYYFNFLQYKYHNSHIFWKSYHNNLTPEQFRNNTLELYFIRYFLAPLSTLKWKMYSIIRINLAHFVAVAEAANLSLINESHLHLKMQQVLVSGCA